MNANVLLLRAQLFSVSRAPLHCQVLLTTTVHVVSTQGVMAFLKVPNPQQEWENITSNMSWMKTGTLLGICETSIHKTEENVCAPV